jgi:hypothetical protein
MAVLLRFVWVQWLLQHATGKIILHKCVLFNITCIGGGILKPFCGLLFQLVVGSINNNWDMRLEVFMAVTMKITVLWFVTLSSLM